MSFGGCFFLIYRRMHDANLWTLRAKCFSSSSSVLSLLLLYNKFVGTHGDAVCEIHTMHIDRFEVDHSTVRELNLMQTSFLTYEHTHAHMTYQTLSAYSTWLDRLWNSSNFNSNFDLVFAMHSIYSNSPCWSNNVMRSTKMQPTKYTKLKPNSSIDWK